MDLGIAGKRALVLSSSRGLGHAIAAALAAEGADVMMVGRDAGRLARNSEAINAAGKGRASVHQADLSTAEGVKGTIAAAEARFGGIDILLNNSGGPPQAQASTVTADQWRSQLEAMVIPITEITRAFLPGMRERKWGRIITIASWGVVQPIPNLAISNTLRSALIGWSKTLAGEVAGDGVTVNALLPGRIYTDRIAELDAGTAKLRGISAEDAAKASIATIPVGRSGKPEEFAAAAAFLASVQAAYITGSALRIDGGAIRSV